MKIPETPSKADSPGALAVLAQHRTPSRDLWPQVAARIAALRMAGSEPLAEEMLQSLAALPRDRAPSADLWPGIAGRIARQRRRRMHAPWLAAAAIAASLVVALGLQLDHDATPHHAPLRAPADLLANEEVRNPALMQTANRPLRSETRALVRANLKIVNGAEAQLQRALAAEPDAAYLHSLLASTKQQQRELRVALNSTELASNDH